MTDLTDAYDRAVNKFIEAGHFTAGEIAGEKGGEMLAAIKWDQRRRLSSAIPGLVAPGEYEYAEQSVLFKLQKSFNDVAGINDVKPLLAAAAAETLALIAARGASPTLVAAEGVEKWQGDGPFRAANEATEALFAEKMLWSQCFGWDKAPDFNHNLFSSLQLRFIGLIPGIDVSAEQKDYDRKVVRNIHEVNSQPGLNDVTRILDATVENVLTDIGLKPAGRMNVPKPLQIRPRAAG